MKSFAASRIVVHQSSIINYQSHFIIDSMLRWRLLLGTLIVAALVGLCWLDHVAAVPGMYLFPVAVVLVVLAGGEVLRLMAAAGARPIGWAVLGGNLLVVSAAWIPVLGWKLGLEGVSPFPPAECFVWTGFALAVGTLLAVVGEICRYDGRPGVTANLAATVLAIVYVGLMLSLLVTLRLAWGIGALASLIIVVKLGDTGAYTVGRLVGRHKMAPILSPGKTIEGAIGGLAFALLGSWAAFRWLVPWLAESASVQHGGVQPAVSPWWGWILFGLLVGTAGMLGDLAESLLKRDAGQKDSSRYLPGFGGVLDILDSILLAAPVAYGCWAFGLVG
jgi:phosphatidate cytidylyltransferase